MKRLVHTTFLALALSFIGGPEMRVRGQSTDSGNMRWLFTMMDTAHSIQPGMNVEQLLEVFEREGGSGFTRTMTKKGPQLVWTYRLRKCPMIKVDVDFEGGVTGYDPKPNAKIIWISKPYLEQEILD